MHRKNWLQLAQFTRIIDKPMCNMISNQLNLLSLCTFLADLNYDSLYTPFKLINWLKTGYFK